MRRVACAAACVTLLLLMVLMQRTPPLRVAPPHPAPLHVPHSAPDPAHAATTNHSRVSSSAANIDNNNNDNSMERKTVGNNVVNTTTVKSKPPPPAAPPPAAAPPDVVLTRDLYEAGHSQPHPELCPRLGAGVKLVILVTSAPAHASQRNAIRLTWGHYAQRSDVSLGFILGAPPAPLAAPLAAEDALYGDMILGNFIDSYSNLTLKSLSLLEWVNTYCPRVQYVLKTDDDMFINVPRLLSFAAARGGATRTLWGKVLKKAYPKRTPHAKYYLSPKQYPGKVLPDFATGPAYLMTGDSIRPLVDTALTLPYVRLEDVYVTGVLAAKVGVKLVSASNEFINRRVSPHACAVQRAVALHMVKYHEQFDLWRKLLDGKTKCT